MRNVIHTDGNYQVELTGKGKFLVRNRAGNELGQFQTNDAALQKIADDREYWENRVEQGNKRHKDRDVFFDANPDLLQNQLAWQDWRNNYYSTIQRLAKYLAAHERNLVRQDASQHHFDRLEQDKKSLAEANDAYNKVVSIDTEMKSAAFACDASAFLLAWNKALALMNTTRIYL